MDKRSEPRSDYFARVQVRVQSENGGAATLSGMIEDRSKSGLGIRVRTPVPVGTEISVLQGSTVLRYEVRRCIRNGMEFLLGARALPSELPE